MGGKRGGCASENLAGKERGSNNVGQAGSKPAAGALQCCDSVDSNQRNGDSQWPVVRQAQGVSGIQFGGIGEELRFDSADSYARRANGSPLFLTFSPAFILS